LEAKHRNRCGKPGMPEDAGVGEGMNGREDLERRDHVFP